MALTRAQQDELDWLRRQPGGGAFVEDSRYAYPRRHYEALEREGLVTIDRNPPSGAFGGMRRWWVTATNGGTDG